MNSDKLDMVLGEQLYQTEYHADKLTRVSAVQVNPAIDEQ